MVLYRRYSIGCWINPTLPAPPDASEEFDDKNEMISEAHRLHKKGYFKSILTYEWSAELKDWVELEELTPKDLPVQPSRTKRVPRSQ